MTASSVLVYLVLLVVAVVVGNLLGFVVAQIRYPQYPWLNTVFFVQILGVVPSLILWSLAGMLAGNCKREMSARKEQSESKAPVAAT